MKTLDYILGVLDTLANIAEMIPGATVPAGYADKLLKIAQASVAAHEAATGQPLDLSLLVPVELAPVTATTTTPITPVAPATVVPITPAQ